MVSVIGLGFLFRLGVALAAFFCAWVALRLLDRATGFDFKRWVCDEKNSSARLPGGICPVWTGGF